MPPAFADDAGHIGLLFAIHHGFPDERRVAEKVGAVGGSQNFGPVFVEGIGDVDVWRVAEGQAQARLREGLMDTHVRLVIHKPEGDFSDAGGPLFDLDAVELVDVELGETADLVEGEGPAERRVAL